MRTETIVVASIIVAACVFHATAVSLQKREERLARRAALHGPLQLSEAAFAGDVPVDLSDDGGSVILEDVPHIRQKPDFCGEACVAMWLRHLGMNADQDWVFDQSRLEPEAARGCATPDLAGATAEIGFDIGSVWEVLTPATAVDRIESGFLDMVGDLRRGVPSVVCMRYDETPEATEHFRLVLGYDAVADEVVYHEPAEDDGAYRRMDRPTFLECWPLVSGAQRNLLVRIRLAGRDLREATVSETPTDADFCQHLRRLHGRMETEGLDGFSVVLAEPFVVVGDEDEETVRRRAKKTVRWFVKHLRTDYFDMPPAQIIDIWLFRDAESYRRHADLLFDDRPETPYGYFSHRHSALVMNIATGGGTLCHEMVHPFMATNFPACPAWFDEGLAGLYEQCGERDGTLTGFTNWRLAGLKEQIRKKNLPSFRELCAMTSHQFYQEDRADNYAQSRYLCYYLQEHGLLRNYWREFRKNADVDPTGYETLVALLGEEDMDAFQERWEAWCLDLTFP